MAEYMVPTGRGMAPFTGVSDPIDKSGDGGITDFFSEIGQGLKNAWYDLTGQTEKTSFYQEQVAREDELIKRQEEREDNAMQRAAADMEAAGLSKYGLSGGAAGSSAGGSSNVHSGSEVKIAAMIDLAKARAEIENVQANTNKANAEAAATTAGVERDDNYYALAAEKQAAELIRMDFENELTKSMTAESAQRISASVQEQARAEAEHVYKLISMNVSNQLAYKDLNTYDERHEAEMAVKRTSAYLNQQRAETEVKQREYIDKQIDEAAARIAHYVAQDKHLSAQDELLAKDYAYRQLQYEVLQYDYDYSKEHLLRTTDPQSKLFGFNVESIPQHVGQGVKDFWHDLWNPIWNWSLFK